MAIDFHCHYTQWGGVRIPEDTPERTLDLLAGNNVNGALIAPLMGLFSSCVDSRPENDAIHEYCSQAPRRLFAAFTVNPLMGEVALGEIRRCRAEHDAKVLKLHPWLQGFSVSSPEMDPVAALCEELGIAILFHDGTPVYGHPLQIARLCRDFPDLTVIAGHCGLGDMWREAMLAAQRYPNYILCFCGPRELGMREIVENVRPEQICVGSDLSTSDKDDAVAWFRWRSFREIDMPDSVRRAIEHDTPARILGLS
jgi:uncharacterized protein